VIAVALAILALTGQPLIGQPVDEPLAEAVDAVVVVRAGASTGAAVVVDDDRAITAAHVVGDADEVTVTVDGRAVRATVTDREPGVDLALLTFDAGNLPALDLAGQLPDVGTDVYAIGEPRGTISMTRGIVSRVIESDAGALIQTDAAVNPGNSGGALITADGTLIGVIVARDPGAEGIGYAVAAPTVGAFLDGDTISGDLPFPFTPGDSDEGGGGGGGGDSGVDVLPPLLALVAGGAVLAGTSHWRTRKRTRRRIDPDVILHNRSGGGHGQP
jgi:S1-C subfamily serine protease